MDYCIHKHLPDKQRFLTCLFHLYALQCSKRFTNKDWNVTVVQLNYFAWLKNDQKKILINYFHTGMALLFWRHSKGIKSRLQVHNQNVQRVTVWQVIEAFIPKKAIFTRVHEVATQMTCFPSATTPSYILYFHSGVTSSLSWEDWKMVRRLFPPGHPRNKQ